MSSLYAQVKDLVSKAANASFAQYKEVQGAAFASSKVDIEQVKESLWTICLPLPVRQYLEEECKDRESSAEDGATSDLGAASEAQPVKSSRKKQSPPPVAKVDGLAPFAGDAEYLRAKEICFAYEAYTMDMSRVEGKKPVGMHDIAVAGVNFATVTRTMADCLWVLQASIGKRLEGMVREPRILRVAKRLQLSDVETEAFVFIASQHTARYSVGGDCLYVWSVARYAKMDPLQLMKFLDENRDHLKQGLIELTNTHN